jgi:hypothetical protein
VVQVRGGKGHTDRDVLLNPTLLEALREHFRGLRRKPAFTSLCADLPIRISPESAPNPPLVIAPCDWFRIHRGVKSVLSGSTPSALQIYFGRFVCTAGAAFDPAALATRDWPASARHSPS